MHAYIPSLSTRLTKLCFPHTRRKLCKTSPAVKPPAPRAACPTAPHQHRRIPTPNAGARCSAAERQQPAALEAVLEAVQPRAEPWRCTRHRGALQCYSLRHQSLLNALVPAEPNYYPKARPSISALPSASPAGRTSWALTIAACQGHLVKQYQAGKARSQLVQ